MRLALLAVTMSALFSCSLDRHGIITVHQNADGGQPISCDASSTSPDSLPPAEPDLARPDTTLGSERPDAAISLAPDSADGTADHPRRLLPPRRRDAGHPAGTSDTAPDSMTVMTDSQSDQKRSTDAPAYRDALPEAGQETPRDTEREVPYDAPPESKPECPSYCSGGCYLGCDGEGKCRSCAVCTCSGETGICHC